MINVFNNLGAKRHYLDMVGVTGSIPVARTTKNHVISTWFGWIAGLFKFHNRTERPANSQDEIGRNPGDACSIRSAPELHPSPLSELADAAFEAAERVRMMGMQNTPTGYEERRQAFIRLSEAQAAAARAHQALRTAVDAGGSRND